MEFTICDDGFELSPVSTRNTEEPLKDDVFKGRQVKL
jgi:hypothetical protein